MILERIEGEIHLIYNSVPTDYNNDKIPHINMDIEYILINPKEWDNDLIISMNPGFSYYPPNGDTSNPILMEYHLSLIKNNNDDNIRESILITFRSKNIANEYLKILGTERELNVESAYSKLPEQHKI
jgi:hypothetical protein